MADEVQKEAPKQDEDLQERVAGFNAGLKSLLGKYELGLVAQPMFTQDGRVAAQSIVVSMRNQPKAEEKTKLESAE